VIRASILQKGNVVVITMGSPILTTGATNLMKLHRLGNEEIERPENHLALRNNFLSSLLISKELKNMVKIL